MYNLAFFGVFTFKRTIVLLFVFLIYLAFIAIWHFVNRYFKMMEKGMPAVCNKTEGKSTLTYISICSTFMSIGATIIIGFQIFQTYDFERKMEITTTKVNVIDDLIKRTYDLNDRMLKTRTNDYRTEKNFHAAFLYSLKTVGNALDANLSQDKCIQCVYQAIDDLNNITDYNNVEATFGFEADNTEMYRNVIIKKIKEIRNKKNYPIIQPIFDKLERMYRVKFYAKNTVH